MTNRDYRDWHKTADAARQYEVLFAPGTYDDWVWELEKARLAVAMRKYLSSQQVNRRILDFACGTGRVLEFLEPMTTEATGVDVSSSMLSLAKRRVRKAQLVCADVTREDILPADHYDLVTAFRFFLNAGTALREDALKAIRRALVNEGILIMNIHRNLVSLRLMGYLFRRYLQGEALNVSSLWSMRRLLARHGFDVLEVMGTGWATPQMYRLLGRPWCSRIERFATAAPILPYLAGNLLLVCRKRGSDPT